MPIEQAETRTQEANLRTDQANTSTDEANARTEQANARTAEANTRTEQADLRTEKAETQSASLSVSELSYRRLFESARDGILILDMVTGRITDANPFLIELLGFSHGEMLGKTVGELSPFKDILSNQAMLERLQKDGYIRYEDLPLETRDGRRISVEFVSNVYQVGDNEVIQCNIRDISERKGSEVALLASERKFRTLVANFPEIITRFDRQLRHLYVSPGIQKYTGISAEDFEGKTNEELGMPPDQAKVWKEQLNHVFETGMRGSHEFEFSHDNQRYVFTRLIVPEFGPDGKVETVMSIVHDITQRKLAETALRESEAFLKESQRIGSLGTYVTDFAIGRWSSSEVLDQILGIGPAYDHSVAGWAALIHPDDRALMVEYLEQEVFSQRQPFDKEYRIVRHNDQAERWVKGLGRMEFDAQGRPVKMIGTIQDITERKQADAALRQSEERYKALFNRSLDCVFLTDFAGNFLDANQASLNLLGFQHEDLSSLTFASLLTEDQLPSAFQTIEEIKATGHQQRLTEYRVRCKDGRQVYVETQSSLIHRDGKPFAIQGIARDITERKEVQAALIESERFNHATLDALGAHVAVLDGKGNILATNKAWREFALANTEDWKAVCEGANYLAVCDAAAKGDPDAAQAAKGIREVMANEKKTWSHEYPCHSPTEERWFYCRVTRFPGDGPVRVVVAHENITERKRAEEELRLFRELIDNSSDGIEVVDPETGRMLDVNETTCRRLGYTREELLSMRVADLGNTAVDFSNWVNHVEQIRQACFIILEGQQKRKDGSTFPIEASIRYVKLDCGYLLASVRDITARKQAADDLHRSEQRYRQLVETARDFILTISSQGIVTSFNPKFFVATGWTADECIGQSYERRIQAGDLPKAQELFGRVLRGEVLPLFELRLNRRDGSPMPTEFTITTRVEKGQVVELLGIGRDITARKQAEKSHARLAMAVEQAAETVVITDTEGTILYANPAFEKTTGYTRAEALGQNPRILKSGKQDDDFYVRMWESLRRGETWSGHFINRRKDGTLYEEEATISPVRDTTGKVVNYVAVKRDVTKEVQLESQLRQSQKMEAFGQLAGGVAHDFNNILAVVQLQAGLLKSNQGLSLEQLDFAREIEKSAQRGADLTRQLLLFSRKQILQPRNLNLKDLVDNMAKMLRRTLGEQVELQLKFAQAPLFVHADPGMLDQILLNLTVNARDAMPKGGKIIVETSAVEFDEVTATQSPQARPGSFVCLSVSDTGCGIPPEILPRIFEPFFTTKGVGQGTGLGLATVFGIVQQHHGWISVYSEVNRGTTFQVYLPRQTKTSDTEFFWSSPAAIRGGNETILLVEDELPVRAAMRIALSRMGYLVLEAATGDAALTVWKEHRDEIRLLLTDLVMPGGMNGKALAARLLQANPKLKVIYASGYNVKVAGQDLRLEDGVNFLAKPFQTDKLAQTIRKRLDQN